MQIPQNAAFAAGFAHALLTARVNQEVSAGAAPRVRQGRGKEKFETK
jgi:hypothetical protein